MRKHAAALAVLAFVCAIGQRPAVVERIVDGDTIVVGGILFNRIVGEQVRIDLIGWGKVRLLGVDSPERGEPGWDAAKKWMEGRLSVGESVCLEGGIGLETFGRWLTTVHDSDGNVNDAIVAAGLAAGPIGPKP